MHYIMKKCNSKTAWTVCTKELGDETYWIIAPFNNSENDTTYEIEYDIGEICVINITKNTYENERRQEIIDLIRNSDSVTMHKILPIHGQDKYVDDTTVTLLTYTQKEVVQQINVDSHNSVDAKHNL